jgi:hypothetical protein
MAPGRIRCQLPTQGSVTSIGADSCLQALSGDVLTRSRVEWLEFEDALGRVF